MVKIRGYDYKSDVMDTNKLNKNIRDEISKLCKEKKMNKGKLVEEFYKTILIRFREGSINSSNGYITLNILRSPITKTKNR